MSDKQMLFLEWGSCGPVEFDLHESGKPESRTKFRGKFQEAEAVNKNKRMYPFDILAENVKRLQETMESGGLQGELDHPCLTDKNFEVLTPSGWKKFDSIRQGDIIYSRVDGRMVESTVTQIVDQPYDGKAIQVKGRSIDCKFSAPHKFLLCKRDDNKCGGEQFYATIEEIHADRSKFSHAYIPKTAKWDGNDAKTVKLKGVKRDRISNAKNDIEIAADKFATFLGLYLAEGNLCTGKHTNRVVISQKTEYGRALVKNMLKDFHSEIDWKEFKDGFYTHDARLYDYLSPLGNKYNKYIPQEIKALSPGFLEKLLIAFAVGDGRILSSGDGGMTCANMKHSDAQLSLDNGKFTRMSVFSVSEQLIDDLHECLVKCNMSGSRSVVTDTKDYQYAGKWIKASSKRPLHCLNFSRTKAIHMDARFLKTIETSHQGRIYCLTTDHGNFYMKYRGNAFWTGNCDSIVHLTNISHKITKLWWDGNVLMGEGEVLNTPAGKVLKALINDGVRIGISSRGVGNGRVNEDGILVIGESYKLVTFDAVADPSTHQAFQKEVGSSKRESYIPQNNTKSTKNERSSIYKTVTKEQLIACLNGIVKSETNKIKGEV